MVRYTVPRMPRVVAVPLGALLCALALLAPAGPVRGVAPAVAQADRGLAGQLLVATEGLQDPRFARTVVYVVRHDADGAFGLVVNRPGPEMPLAPLLFLARKGKFSPDAIYQRFAGIDGSAYFIGGFGMTALASGNVIVVPIRSGVGLRLGANVGYLKFTPQATWNPL